MSDQHAHARLLNLFRDNGHDEIEAKYLAKRVRDLGFVYRSPNERHTAHRLAAATQAEPVSELTAELNANLNASRAEAKAMIRAATAKAKAEYANDLQDALERRDADHRTAAQAASTTRPVPDAVADVVAEAARARAAAVAAALARMDAETKRAEACEPCNPIPPHPQATEGCRTADAPPLVLFSHAS